MGLRNTKIIKILDWFGLQSFAANVNLRLGWWHDSNNAIITNDGSAQVLRSPANFNTAISSGNIVLSAFDYAKNSGNLILWDENLGAAGISSVRTHSTTGSANTTVRSNQADARWKSLTINDMAYRLNGSEFIQTDGTNIYTIGITSQTTAPSISFVAGGAGSLATGVTVSYAYRNSTTKHVSAPSPASGGSGASGANLTLRIPVTASTVTGVDGIVLFITQDGGSVRYLYTNTSGDPQVNPNITGNIDISLASIGSTTLDTLTPETAYNTSPPTNAYFMFRWRNRLCLLDFRGATTRQQIQYNIFENCYYGQPWESWWPLNTILIPSKNDAARAGIETPLGALILGEMDAYLVRGSLSDKIAGPEGFISVTESIQSLNWSIGTRSPYTLVTTTFGEIWLDQNKRIQMWQRGGFPTEAGLPIRASLASIQDTAAARNMAEAVWFQHGQNGGVYVLTASTTGSTNDRLFFLTVYRDPETNELRFGTAVSDIAAQSIFTASVSGKIRCFIGVTDRLREILDPALSGAGWSSTQTRFFKTIVGNDDEFCYWHSLKFDCTFDPTSKGLTVSIANLDGTESRKISLVQDEGRNGPWYGTLDSYGYRKVITFSFNSDDTADRTIQNMSIRYAPTGRLI